MVDRYRRSHYGDYSQAEQICDRYDPDWLAYKEEIAGTASPARVNVVVDIDTDIDSIVEGSESDTEDSSDEPIHDTLVTPFEVQPDPSEI